MAEYHHNPHHIRFDDDGQQIMHPTPTASNAGHPPAGAGGANYINFNQFVMQHNLAQQQFAPPPLPPQPVLDATPVNSFMYAAAAAPTAFYGMQQPQPPMPLIPDAGFAYAAFGAAAFDHFPSPTAALLDMDVVRKSNLMATASEFVPQNYAAKVGPTAAVPAVNIPAAVVQTVAPAAAAAAAMADKSTDVAATSAGLGEAATSRGANDGAAQITERTAAVTLSPSQGAIRKQYPQNDGQGHQHTGRTNTEHHNNNNTVRGQNQRGTTDRPPNQRNQRQSNGSTAPGATWSSTDSRHDVNGDERNNWRDQRRAATGNSGGGSGRTHSQYNDDRSYGKEYASGGGYDGRRSDLQQQQHMRQDDHRNGGRNSNNARGNNGTNPFSRQSRNDGGYEQQQSNSRPQSATASNHNSKANPFNNNNNHRDHRDQRDHQQPLHRSSNESHRSSNESQTGRTNNAQTSPSKHQQQQHQQSHFDKKKHPEFKPNRNLKAPPSASDLLASDRITGECSQREKLIREIDAGRLECLVCCENIKPAQSTWCCANCFHIIHLSCIIKWANSSKDEAGWRCPACQHVTKPIPDAYWCFCGKTRNPQYNRNDVAHTCGELCGKADGCPHPCTLLCHPGPCATCHAMVTRECGCGRTKRTMQCCQKEEVQCALVCDKELACGAHRCEQPCHPGDCATCEEQVEHRCHCGKDKRQVACVAENNEVTRYSCKKLCNKQLACKNHKCKRVCHADECGDCQLMPEAVTSCPCGQLPIVPGSRKACTDPVPLCEAICQRPLKCGQPSQPHQCPSRCHTGVCPPCGRETAVRCRCGHMEQMVKCRTLQTRSDDARCKKRCVKKRNCGKHKCNQECCIDIDHVCPLPCTFQLSCGKHKCDQTCHKGRCQRCYRSSFVELYCECRAQVIYPPVPCGSKRPVCDRPCSRQHGCDHPVQHNCHAAAQCPPCMAFVAIRCYGGHEERKTIPCSQGEFSCGLRCGKALRCGRHKCVKTCHAGVCEKPEDVCKQSCTKLRVMCGHRCVAPCHEGECPDTACREQVEVLCQCGNRKATRTCQEFANEYRRIASAKFATTMESMQQEGGAMVQLSDVLGPIKMSNNKTLDCNDECKVLERNRRLALGLQIRNPDTAAKYAPKYTEFAKGWARKDPQLVGSIHDKLTELVKLAKQSQQKSRSHSFPTMNWEKRQLVHELCQTFGIESVAYDAEPNRNVVATATRDTSWLPSLSLMEVIKRESGQRRIPVPMNNAWGVKR